MAYLALTFLLLIPTSPIMGLQQLVSSLGRDKMRKAAGILMVIFGVTTMGFFVYGIRTQAYYDYDLAFNLLMIFSTIFTITGGVFCLKRKFWIVCLISSALLSYFATFFWLAIIPYISILYFTGGIIPLIFVCLRKREWQEIRGK